MTTTPAQRPDTIRLADALKRRTPFLDGSSTIDHAEKELRRQHAEIDRLTDAYCGAREDLAIWKRRALEAEEKLRTEIARLTAENEALKAVVSDAVTAERERLCAAIKAADDKASDDDYMLDSDDCISVIRGTWNSV